eukprot:CAMPEP_0115313326 /NCGR_PEP_ID=MMETSP0270-20121206/76409_1 /TAXON_ID=71861 /ORGANISM="Scrippsiella trochoidea, Strain CCMP3099" /LENGTH=30 /DNA_ID= /DNA_START= /DNA_END= /DNA_ORIENTATION=
MTQFQLYSKGFSSSPCVKAAWPSVILGVFL